MNDSAAPFDKENIYHQIFLHSPEAIVILSKLGVVEMVNGRMTEWLGYSKQEIEGKNLLQLPFFHTHQAEIVSKNFLKRISGKQVDDYTTQFFTKENKAKIGKIKGSLLRDADKKITGVLVMITEVTKEYTQELARQKKERILEALSFSAKHFLKSQVTENDFQKVIKNIGESAQVDRVILIINDLLNQKYEWLSPGTPSVTDTKEYPNFFDKNCPFPFIEKKLQKNIQASGTQKNLPESVGKLFESYSIQSFVLQPIFIKKRLWAYLFVHDCHNERTWLEEEKDAITIASEIIGAAIEKNHVELQLKETVEYWKHEKDRVTQEINNTRKFRLAVQNATDGIVLVDQDFKISYANTAWLRMFEQKEIDSTNQYIDDIISPQEGQKLTEKIVTPLQKGIPHTIDEIVIQNKKAKQVPVRLTFFPIQDKNQTHFYVGIFEDITRRVEIDQMKTQFISIASHQLNTPLSAMKWFLELLLNGKAGALNPKQLEFLHNISESNLRMIALVRSLLNISRIESGRIIIDPRRTNINLLVQNVVHEIQPEVTKRKQKIVVDIGTDVKNVVLDPRLVRHVYINLLSNSSKYSPEKSIITVSVRKKEDMIISHVKDHGVGIPKKDQPKIFTKFFRAENVLKMQADGSGLGMYLVKIIVDSSGGTIGIKSEENKGTDIWFTLPIKGIKPKSGEVLLDQGPVL